jgi:ketosteroid isomerase-like protein
MDSQALCGNESEIFVRRLFDCIDGGDWPGLSELLDEEAVYERPGYAPFIGKRAVMTFYLETRIVSSGKHVIEKVLSDGANIACWGSFSGVDKKGRGIAAGFADVYCISAGRIRSRRTFFDSPAI